MSEPNRLMRFFKFDHIPEPSKSCAELAQKIDETLPETVERTAELCKLLEVNDCFVRVLPEKKP